MSKDNFNTNVIGDLLSSVNRRVFKNLVKKYNTDYRYRNLNTWQHFVAILIGQYSNYNSLRDIVETINFHKVEHYHLGLKNNICRSILSEANSKRDWRIFKDLFLYLISDMKNKELIETKDIITLIDSTPIRINEDWCEKL